MNEQPHLEPGGPGAVGGRGLVGEPRHIVVFLPFARLATPQSVAGVTFVPLRDREGVPLAAVSDATQALDRILSGYLDRHGQPLSNCVVVTIDGQWDIKISDLPKVRWAASLLFLAAWSCNDYYPPLRRRYVNSTCFRVVGQAFTGSMPVHIAVSARRRDGSTTDGGYDHGEFTFSLPPQVSITETIGIDEPLLRALDDGSTTGSAIVERLRTGLPFVELANTDDDFMTEHAETILMASAFEQLLAGDGSSYRLAKRFGLLFERFGNVTVDEVRKSRPAVTIDTSTPERAAAQPKWWVHRKWMEELYDVRSQTVHKGEHSGRPWAWALGEHLVMAAHVFPLTVKLGLESEGRYVLTDEDKARCRATDRLLASTSWVDEGDRADRATGSWSSILSQTTRDVRFEAIREAVLKKYPELGNAGNGGRSADPDQDV